MIFRVLALTLCLAALPVVSVPAHAEAVAIGLTAPQRTEKAQALANALQMGRVMEVMRDEGVDYGKTLEDELLSGSGGARWQAALTRIYDPVRMRQEFEAALASQLPADAQVVDQMLDFFASDRGQRILGLEIEARLALLDTAVEDAAKLRAEELAAAEDPLIASVRRFMTAGDLVEMNVAGALTSNLAFYKGMAAEGGFGEAMTEQDMLAEVWGQEAEIRTDTEEWLLSYLLLAYEPLPAEDLEAYIAFTESDTGRAMNAALFSAFDVVFTAISEDLGAAAARQMQGDDI